jgi:hypothetical protein
MRLIKKHLFLLSCLGAALFFSAPLSAAEFTADTLVSGGKRSSEGRFYYAGDRWRLEEHLPKNEFRVTLFRGDKKSLYVLWPDKKRYVVQPLPEKEYQIISTRKPGEEVERVVLGQEKLSGFAVTKYRVTYKVQDRVIENIEWFSKDLGTVIKSHAVDNAWFTETRNIKVGDIDRKLFEVPEDFESLSAKDVLKGPKPPHGTDKP